DIHYAKTQSISLKLFKGRSDEAAIIQRKSQKLKKSKQSIRNSNNNNNKNEMDLDINDNDDIDNENNENNENNDNIDENTNKTNRIRLIIEGIPPNETFQNVTNIFNKITGFISLKFAKKRPGVGYVYYDNEQNAVTCINRLQGFKMK